MACQELLVDPFSHGEIQTQLGACSGWLEVQRLTFLGVVEAKWLLSPAARSRQLLRYLHAIWAVQT
jgi:hypothetical protein